MYCVGDHSDWTLKVFRRPDLTRIKYKDKLIKRNHTHNIRFHHLWILWYSMNWTNRVHESFLVWERKWYGREAKFQKPLMLLWNVYNLNDCNIKMNNLSIWKQARFIKLKWIWSEQIHKKKWNSFPSRHVLYIYMHAVSNGLQLFMWTNIKKNRMQMYFTQVCMQYARAPWSDMFYWE